MSAMADNYLESLLKYWPELAQNQDQWKHGARPLPSSGAE